MFAQHVRMALIAATLTLGGILPVASAPRPQVAYASAGPLVHFAPAYIQHTALAGRTSYYDTLEYAYTAVTIHNAHFVLSRLDRGILAFFLYASHGLFHAGSTHDALLRVIVPRTTRPGVYVVEMRLRGWTRAHRAADFGALFVVVRVVRLSPPVAFIHWTPSSFGTVTVDQGQTVNKTAMFISTADLLGVHVFRNLSNLALASGLSVRIVSTSLSGGRLLANVPVLVTVQIHAGPHARLGRYGASLQVYAILVGSSNERFLPHSLSFRIDVDRGPQPTATATTVAPTATSTSTATPIPPTATSTSTSTPTPVPPTATSTSTATPIPPTATATKTSTATAVPPTATNTVVPGTPTATTTR